MYYFPNNTALVSPFCQVVGDKMALRYLAKFRANLSGSGTVCYVLGRLRLAVFLRWSFAESVVFCDMVQNTTHTIFIPQRLSSQVFE